MKRRESLTDEDWSIWIGRLCAYSLRCPLYEVSVLQDRRDADLMLALQDSRRLCDQLELSHCIVAGFHTALAEYDDPEVSLVELGLEMRIPKLPDRYR
jgi:hypothetical protein